MFMYTLRRYVASTVLLIPKTFRRVLIVSLDSCAEIKRALSVSKPVVA